MTTLQLAIVCATALASVGLVGATAVRVRKAGSGAGDVRRLVAAAHRLAAVTGEERDVLAQLAVLFNEQRGDLRTLLERAEQAPLPGPSLVGRTVAVHTRRPDDQTVRGILAAHHADRLVIRDAVYAMPGGKLQPAGGAVSVPLAAVSSWQEIHPTGEDA